MKNEMLICKNLCVIICSVISVIIEDSLLKVNRAIIMCFKEKKNGCKKSFCLVEEWFYSTNIGGIIDHSLWKQTVSLSFICVMGNGSMNSNLCLEFSLQSTRILSPTLYW